MGLKNQANLDTARTIAQVKFDELFNAPAPGAAMEFTEVYSTGADTDELVFVTFLDTVREWLGAKEFGRFEAFRQSVELTTYEDSFALSRRKVEYDSPEAIGRAIRAKLEQSRKNSDDKIIYDALVQSSGAGPTGFDGVSLINDSHPLGDSTYDNKTTSALSFTSYDAAVQAMQGFKSANGEPLGVFPKKLICGPKLRKTAFEIAKIRDRVVAVDNSGAESGTRVAASSIDNVFAGDNIDVVIWDRLTGATDDYWYLVDDSKGEMPMLLKQERDWELIDMTDMTSEGRYVHDQLRWSLEADKAVAAGAWPLIYAGIL